MMLRAAVLALGLAIAGCGQQVAPAEQEAVSAPQLEAPTPETEPSRVFAAANEAAIAATGQLTVSLATRMPDAGDENADAQEILTLTGATGVAVEAQIVSAVSPATLVQGQTLRALLSIPVEEPQVLVYRVLQETKAGGRGLCAADIVSHVVVWEPAVPGQSDMKVLGVIGGAPGAGSARPCAMLEYRRA
ncbi:MAG: hypothetical protein JNM59_01810 [Hyphomonadaceae bacterium]|nr:hypothetical protein [Hyphomonadaceae bacterium]